MVFSARFAIQENKKWAYSKLGCITFISCSLFAIFMIDKDLYLLLHIVQKTGLHGTLETSTGALANELGISQQTISRKLQEFTEQQLLIRDVTPTGVTLKLAPKGKEKLCT